MTLDALALPPEINAARLISGAGLAPMEAVAGAYTTLSGGLEAQGVRLAATLAAVDAIFQGDSAALVQARFTPYVAWMHSTAAQLAVGAGRAQAQATSYGAALAAMPTLPELATLQTQHAVLIATNPLVAGANTPLIVANEAAYAAEWVRASAVQSAYFAESAANSTFELFLPAPPLAVPANGGAEAAIAATWGHATLTALKDAQQAANDAHSSAQNLQMMMNYGSSAAIDVSGKDASRGKLEDEKAEHHARRNAELAALTPAQQQQAAQAGEQVAGQVAQVPSQAMSGVSSMNGQVAHVLHSHGITSPGFYGTSPTSPTLQALGGAGGNAAVGTPISLGSAAGLSGMSGLSTGFRLPGNWTQMAGLGAAALPSTPGASPQMPGVSRPPMVSEPGAMGPTGASAGGVSDGERRVRTIVDHGPVFVDTDVLREQLHPTDTVDYVPTVSVGAQSAHDQPKDG